MVKYRYSVLLIFIILIPLSSTYTIDSLNDDYSLNLAEENTVYELERTNHEVSSDTQSIHEFGNQEDFWTANLRTNEWFTVRATLLSVGDHCYIYMDNRTISYYGQNEAIRRSKIFSSEFDTTIYPKNYELMGNPNGTLGDIDGDPRITVFLVQGVGSYYLQHNELVGYPYSNNREMVFVNSNMHIINTIAVICHETNHLFLFNYDLDEAVFMIEGLAEFSMYYAGYMSNTSFMQGEMVLNITYSAAYYSQNPSVSLLYFDSDYYSYASYGAGYLFLFYIAEKYGIQIIKDLIPIDDLDGPEALEYVLLNHGYDLTFNDIFLDFITACTIDELGIYDDLYGFVNADYQISIRRPVSVYPKTFSNIRHRYYGIEILEFFGTPDKFTLELETPDYPSSLGVVTIIQDDNGWNITQLTLTGNGSKTRLYCSGTNIQRAYVVTSKIRVGISLGPRLWMASPISELDFTFESGHQNPTAKTSITIFTFTISLLIMSNFVLMLRRRKKT
ncbi:MAG: hypothetical protein H7641_05380 [Candidatus Heimdallarchaeota archaeon]|nr:hypothetical protein [Candidatus Heimdallarchaeota archaeon]MCK4876993.1 hypothetical protein [Candidatus Heimdallarchaeota archaeon]